MTANFDRMPLPKARPGERKPLIGDLKARQLTLNCKGLPDGCDNYMGLIGTFRDASPALNLTKSAVLLYERLFSYSNKLDWKKGRLALVWPSNNELMEKLRISEKTLKMAFRQLREVSLISFKDSPTKVRYGRRKKDGTIDVDSSWGIVLNPITGLYARFRQLANNLAIQTRYRKQIRHEITSVTRDAEMWLTYARAVLNDLDYNAQELALTSIIDRFASTGRDYKLKEQILTACKARLSLLEAFLDDIATDGLDDLVNASTADADAMNEYLNKKHSAQGNNYPPIRTITALSEGLGNRLSDDGSSRNFAIPPKYLALIEAAENAEETPKRHKYETKTPSFDQTVACLPFELRQEIRDDHGWFQLADLLMERCIEYGVLPTTFRDAIAEMQRPHACAALVVIINKAETLNKPNNYFGSLIFRHRQGTLKIERSLFGIIAERKKPKTQIEQLALDGLI